MAFKARKKIQIRRAKRAARKVHKKSPSLERSVEFPLGYTLTEPGLWDRDAFLEAAMQLSDRYSKKICRHFNVHRRGENGSELEDVKQEAMLSAIHRGKENRLLVRKQLWWGAIRGVLLAKRKGVCGARIMGFHVRDEDYDPANDEYISLKRRMSKEKRYDYLVDCQDTVLVLINKIDIEPWEADMLVRHIVWGETYQSLADEIGVSHQAMQERLSTKLEFMRKVALERDIPNPMDDYYRIEKGRI